MGRASDSLFEDNAYDMILNEAVFSNKTGMENTLGMQAAHKCGVLHRRDGGAAASA